MFRKPQKPSSGKKTNLDQFGIFNIPDTMDDDDEAMDISDEDIDLEAELAALSGGSARQRPRKPAPVPPSDLDAMIAASLQDVPSDEDVSGDEDDPALLSELQELGLDDAPPAPPAPPSAPAAAPLPRSTDGSTVSLLHDRITNYTVAERNAKANGESSRARRFERGLKTLHTLLRQAQAGQEVSADSIPPPVVVGRAPAEPAPPAEPPAELDPPAGPPAELEPPAEPPAEPTEPPRPPLRKAPSIPDTPSMFSPPVPARAAPEAPAAPPRSTSVRAEPPPEPREPPPAPLEDPARQEGLLTIMRRQHEFKAAALAARRAGDKPLALEYLRVVKQFDVVASAFRAGQEMDLAELPTPEAIAAGLKGQQKGEEQTQGATESQPDPHPEEPKALITATTMEEALKQRLAGFQEKEAAAIAEGNSSKARRMARIVKQYKDAVALHAAGRAVNVDELPPIAGYGPIPAGAPAPAPRPAPAPAPAPAAAPAPAPPKASRYDKQISFLLQRQKEFREAAIQAKKAGNIEQAREYLRSAKGFNSVIEAARGGLTVDLKSLPLPPKAKKQLEQTFDIVTAADCAPDVSLGSDTDALSRLQHQLEAQLQLCRAARDHCRAMGSVAEMNRFEQLAVSVEQDLGVIVVAKSLNQPPPKFHYESRQFSIVQCNTDLNENELELTIVRGIAYNVPNPKEVDTYVKFEFPYPQDAPVSERTAQVKDTNNPQYGAVFSLPIQRGARACLRVFKRHAVKFEVYSRGGWFSRDALLGTAAVKLAPLETQVTLHDAFPLMEGRRAAGGSLEVKLRVRTPLLRAQLAVAAHRWLVLDH